MFIHKNHNLQLNVRHNFYSTKYLKETYVYILKQVVLCHQ